MLIACCATCTLKRIVIFYLLLFQKAKKYTMPVMHLNRLYMSSHEVIVLIFLFFVNRRVFVVVTLHSVIIQVRVVLKRTSVDNPWGNNLQSQIEALAFGGDEKFNKSTLWQTKKGSRHFL